MKVFQILHIYPPYIPYFEKKYDVKNMSYNEHRKTLIKDRFYASHVLKPCLEESGTGFYTLWDYKDLQLKWAKERGMEETDLVKIVLAQISEEKPDVFYTFSPNRIKKKELDLMSKSIIKICWSAAPGISNEVFTPYQTRLTNLPTEVLSEKETGFRSDFFQPAHDPVMNSYAKNEERPIDLFFYGQYWENAFKNRNKSLRRLLEFKQKSNLNIEISLQYKIKRQPLINLPFIRRFMHRIISPEIQIRNLAIPPVYGRNLYKKISRSKLVFNAGVDFSGEYKVNMRNFEVLGCGAHLLTDDGIYPDGFEKGVNFSSYKNMDECILKIESLIQDKTKRLEIAKSGHQMITKQYSKEDQWNDFKKIIESL